ncbi:MFS transporter [Tsukamurella pseudospumae]|uniref:Major facilitator superfamily (MFS) profile domain-containing protein n=1 Tax=Tsukamurella pseudospumae TaxID=239498 RepID=A0A137ZRI3_9ACTN|nr:MFS transporter [Tsukamurella pseudospumae]KXP00776.1 hypothetical protein AXK61_14380 [Tsukamurella pseudospumae]
MSTVVRIRALPGTVQLLLASYFLFNVGFYLVVPFLAGHLESLGMAGATIGLVLGLRTLSQQGMFFVGGALSDRFGARRMILSGIAMRVVGFVVLAFAGSVATVVVGTLLSGFAAALFAPAVESTNAIWGRRLEDEGVLPRAELFGLEQMSSRAGNVVGPAVGAALIWAPFSAVTVISALLFVVMWVGFWRLLPHDAAPGDAGAKVAVAWRTVTRNGRFMLLAVFGSLQLGAYGLVYVSLPVELLRTDAEGWLGWIFAGAAVLVIAGQPAAVAMGRRLGRRRAVGLGLGTMGMSFLLPVATAGHPDGGHLVAVIAWVVVLHLGQMLLVPPLRDAAGVLAGERYLGAHYGMLATLGGVTSLLVSLGAGWGYDRVADGAPAWLGWAIMAAVVIVAALGLRAVTPQAE